MRGDLGAAPASEELYRAEERFRLLVQAVTDYAIYMLDPAGLITTWNAGAERIKGYRAHEVIGRHFSLFFLEEDRRSGGPEHALAQAQEGGHYEYEGYRLRKDGSKFWASVVLTPIRDVQGRLLGFAKVTRDLTDRLEAERVARALVHEQARREASLAAEAALRESEERYRQLSQRLEIILEGLGDGVTVQDSSGAVIFANTAAARTCGYGTVEEFLQATPDRIGSRFEVLAEDGSRLDRSLLPGRRVLSGEPSAAAVIQVSHLSSGRLAWINVRASGVAGADGKPELAINIWHDVTEDRRREQREKYLAQATSALAESLDYTATLTTLAKLLVPGLADWCSIELLQGDELKPLVVAHADPEKVRYARQVGQRYPSRRDQPRGVWNVIRTGTSELYADIPDALLHESAQDAEHLDILRAVGMKSVIIVPLRCRDRVLGAMSLVSAESGRGYDAQDLTLAEKLGRHAGTAIENAMLYRAEQRARDRLELLARAGKFFASAASYEDMLGQVVQVALPALADFAFFDVVESGGVRRIAAAHQDPHLDALVKSTTWARSERTDKNLCALSSGESGFHSNIDDAWLTDVATSPEHLALLRALNLGSLLTIPLRARGELLGSLTLCYGGSGRQHQPEDLPLAEELARRAAIALANVRLYEQARESANQATLAAKRAEEANRVKDDFLATVSHELRTPLNAIVGWSALLQARELEPPIAKAVATIHRNAVAQGKIIEDILDVSRIIMGKLGLALKAADLVAVVRDAIEVVLPSAAAKDISVHFEPAAPDCLLVADPERLQQVVWNLLSNAIKFSQQGGSVAIKLQHDGSKVSLAVTDSGRGIDPVFLPFVFDRFKQADGSATRRVGGLGLGLAIVRHLVELHGGHVEAFSAGTGSGATFTITLPVRAVLPGAMLPGGEEQLQRHAPAAAPVRQLAGRRVLVVDDEVDARELLEAVLTEAGASVATAASAAEALAIIPRFRPHVLVSDIGMPDEDGYSLAKRVSKLDRASGGGIPSIALTAYTRGLDKTRATAAGFSTHVSKPVSPDHLVAAVANLAILVQPFVK
jgi:PAS domain S-box-containing protein